MLAFMLEEMLADAGFTIAGVAMRLEQALEMIDRDQFDVAVLDANLGGVSAAPAAMALKATHTPFIVLSGYSAEQHKTAFSGALCLQKPCKPETLISALRGLLPPEGVADP